MRQTKEGMYSELHEAYNQTHRHTFSTAFNCKETEVRKRHM